VCFGISGSAKPSNLRAKFEQMAKGNDEEVRQRAMEERRRREEREKKELEREEARKQQEEQRAKEEEARQAEKAEEEAERRATYAAEMAKAQSEQDAQERSRKQVQKMTHALINLNYTWAFQLQTKLFTLFFLEMILKFAFLKICLKRRRSHFVFPNCFTN